MIEAAGNLSFPVPPMARAGASMLDGTAPPQVGKAQPINSPTTQRGSMCAVLLVQPSARTGPAQMGAPANSCCSSPLRQSPQRARNARKRLRLCAVKAFSHLKRHGRNRTTAALGSYCAQPDLLACCTAEPGEPTGREEENHIFLVPWFVVTHTMCICRGSCTTQEMLFEKRRASRNLSSAGNRPILS